MMDNNQQLHKLFYSDEMKEIRYKYYKGAYDQGRFDEYAESTYGTYKENEEVKPIRPTILNFESDEEYDEFIQSTTSTSKDTSVGKQVRELMKKHRESKKRD